MGKMLSGKLLLAFVALALAACGGGGGGSGTDSTPPPPPQTQTCWDGSVIPVTQTCPPQTKTCPDGSVIPVNESCPPPPTSPAIFTSVTTDTNFAVLGLEAPEQGIAASMLTRDGFSVRYDAATQKYLIQLPSLSEVAFIPGTEDASFWRSFVATIGDSGARFEIFKPASTNPEIQLAYTSFGITRYEDCSADPFCFSEDFGFFAFGLPTPSSGMPVTGTASYDAVVRGMTLNSGAFIRGDATLQFNFGAGTLSGHLDPVHDLGGVETSLGSYDFVNTVFGAGATTFSGELSHADTSILGAFDGQFTGPTAEELMARWTAPYLQPGTQTWGEMFGVLVGKRQ